jgi:hypothetical protein
VPGWIQSGTTTKSKIAANSAPAFSQEELVAGIRARDESAWPALSERYNPALRWIARYCRLPTEEPGDAVQLTWLRCLEHIDQLSDAERAAYQIGRRSAR